MPALSGLLWRIVSYVASLLYAIRRRLARSRKFYIQSWFYLLSTPIMRAIAEPPQGERI